MDHRDCPLLEKVGAPIQNSKGILVVEVDKIVRDLKMLW